MTITDTYTLLRNQCSDNSDNSDSLIAMVWKVFFWVVKDEKIHQKTYFFVLFCFVSDYLG